MRALVWFVAMLGFAYAGGQATATSPLLSAGLLVAAVVCGVRYLVVGYRNELAAVWRMYRDGGDR